MGSLSSRFPAQVRSLDCDRIPSTSLEPKALRESLSLRLIFERSCRRFAKIRRSFDASKLEAFVLCSLSRRNIKIGLESPCLEGKKGGMSRPNATSITPSSPKLFWSSKYVRMTQS
ncbi:hypothetical protein VNO77_39061 [Canavalia gladiata]|uniref:Uncharacterized protein n=1 Tax=Canavalia gladiata TaxID=3824 RepID=A0AAN9KBJ0_CANGL